MKIQILDRYEVNSDWHEIYADGELLYEGELTVTKLLNRFIVWLSEKHEAEIEIREITLDYKPEEGEEYTPPLHAMTGESYWSDWENAEKRDLLP